MSQPAAQVDVDGHHWSERNPSLGISVIFFPHEARIISR